MSYTPRRGLRPKAKSIDMSQYKTVHDLPALRRKRTLAFNRLSKTLEIAKLAENNTDQIDRFIAHFTESTRHAARFEEAHESILSLIETKAEEAEDELRCKCDEIYFDIVAIHRRLTATSSEMNKSLDSSAASSVEVKVKLPKINLPTFSGNIKTWSEFYDVFQSLIHENKSLSDTERMHYLVSSLTGDALALIRVFPITGKYYCEAYEALVARYRDKRELAFTCWKEMQSLSLQSNNAHEFRRVLDTFNENLAILKRLELPIEQWDFILCYLLLSKLNSTMRCEFEQEYPNNELPTYTTLKSFLYAKCEALVRDIHFTNTDKGANVDRTRSSTQQNFKATTNKKATTSAFLSNTDVKPSEPVNAPSVNTNIFKCTFCGEGHSINHCLSFAKKPIDDRVNHAQAQHWCFNCLKPSHGLRDCKSIFNCQKCRQRHHTLLHRDDVSDLAVVDSSNEEKQINQKECGTSNKEQVVLTNLGDRSLILLSTAKIEVKDSSGNFQMLRALIDSGSQAHFITERAADSLGVERTLSTRKISGLGQSKSSVSGIITLDIGINGRVLFNIDALTLPTICSKMPAIKLNKTTWNHVQHLPLADPECHLPGTIDILLGAEIFSSLLLNGVISGGPTRPSALNTVFGWLLTGNVESVNPHDGETKSFFVSNEICIENTNDRLDEELKRFWELDSIPTSTKLTPDEELCEAKYANEHSRDDSGRYIITLPFKTEREEFPGSRDIALKRFRALERRLTRDSELRQQYNDFMRDYIDSGHMTKVPLKDLSKGKYYIPHHCVIRPDSSTTKLRVVFDASAKDATGICLNETLLTGEKLQANIAELLLRFRLHAVVYTSDVRQMYRQILCDETHRDYQRIFWRFDESSPLIEYRLNTVTYGTSSAPHSALRTIKQLIIDHGKDYPKAAAVLDKDVYVDDIVSGCSTLELAQQTKREIINMMEKGCFQLRKWASNVPNLLVDLSAEERLINSDDGGVLLDVETSDTIKILGLKWNPMTDNFMFDVKPLKRNCTKRTILSELARIFDPLGFLVPLTFLAKCYIQKLWILKIDWDEIPTQDIVKQWESYCDQLDLVKNLQIPRGFSVNKIKSIQFHGFADSSELGYGSVVYLRTEDHDNKIQVFFICAKSRVAPVKKISLPRLELCAAVLLSDLIKFVQETYSTSSFPESTTYAWSDSTVVLAWLESPSCRWKTFVANRVSHIEDTIPDAKWNHVPTEDNPADMASRGLLPGELVRNQLWWAGPSWLAQPIEYWPTKTIENDIIAKSEERIITLLIHEHDTSHNILDELVERFSSIRKTQRILAYCLRFIHNCRRDTPTHVRNNMTNINQGELHETLLLLVKHVQAKNFCDEISRLTQGKVLSKQMRKLNPFVDENGILRVGGRLSRSGLEFEHKHPALLPRKSRVTYLIIEAIHHENCHPGINTVQYLITQQFWILSPKRAIRHCLSKCVKCFRARPIPLEPFMGDLPASRVNQVKPFSVVGVDYAGPFRIKLGNHRGAKLGKAYLCLFVCFTTKAVHLEVASDMSTEAYIAALRRFIGRRGRVNTIQSDNGTNFVGACNKLNTYMQQACERDQITFRFNPPSSPHFGGVWEIQVKAVKSHLYRIIGDQTLTFEELNTVFIQIEAMLNSRPLCPLSSDPNDVNVLTPGHFLTLEPLTAIPDRNLTDTKLNRLGRWQLLQRFQQDFWNRWKIEYLQSLTQRSKWTKHCQPLVIGAVVLLKDENTIPLHWPLARVIELHCGSDEIARVATVRTANGSIFKRALTKICVLPTDSNVDLNE